MATLSAVVLAISLGLSLLLSWQLLRVVGIRDLDEALAREYERFSRAVATSTAEASGTGGAVTEPMVRQAVDDYYLFNPGSATYLTIVRFGGSVVVSPDPPAELAEAAFRLAIPAAAADGYDSLDTAAGEVRSLQAPIRLDGADIGSVQVVGLAEPISDATAASLRWLAVLAGVSMVVGGSALALALVRGLRPLRELAATAQRTGELEHLSERVREPRRADEVGVLAGEFNRMLARLEGAARARTEFLASVSHELRTPVTIARGHVETLERDGAEDPDHVRETARVIREELTHVGRLVDDLLALDRAELEHFVIPVPVALSQLFAELELRLSGLRMLDVELLPAPDEVIAADSARLQQALLNLAVNASVHTPAGTRVIVSAERHGAEVVLLVTDDGPGIAPEILERVREPFVRKAHGGHDSSGLGLAVVDVVTRAHGGRVDIETGPEGTRVGLVLPVEGPVGEDARVGDRASAAQANP